MVTHFFYTRTQYGGGDLMERKLLNVKETAGYLGIGLTQTRQLMKRYDKTFVVHIGNRSYAHIDLLNKWLLGRVGKEV